MNKHIPRAHKEIPATYFAPPERATTERLKNDIALLSNNPVINALLLSVGGLLAVLNEERQIVSLNSELLRELGIMDAEEVLGLRPGEAIQCIHSGEMPGGCGTSQSCSGCGAVLAIVTSMASNHPVERKCVATVERNGRKEDICLRVRSSPLAVDSQRFLLLFIHDITQSEKWASLERAFFHDISNIITGIMGAAELMKIKDAAGKNELSKQIVLMVERLDSEVRIQRSLSADAGGDYRLSSSTVLLSEVFKTAAEFFATHPAAADKKLVLSDEAAEGSLSTDINLLMRVLTNMLLNAFEASEMGDEVRFTAERARGLITFSVWNRQPIPSHVAMRIFQRHFSTKTGTGRGVGTFGMKLIGESMLGGHIDFYSTEAFGTVFRFTLPEHIH
jgi:signal transduction histidine kinase